VMDFYGKEMSMPTLILASGSPRRRDLLREAGLDPEIIPPAVVEFGAGDFPPHELCLRNAELKAGEILKVHPDEFVIASDTVVALDGSVYGKPESLEEAAGNLRHFSGRVHQVMTGVVIFHGQDSLRFVEMSEVKFRDLSEEVIRKYLAKVSVLDKAGGYAIQSHGDWIVEEIKGDYQNIVGLPVAKVLASLVQMGFPVPEAK